MLQYNYGIEDYDYFLDYSTTLLQLNLLNRSDGRIILKEVGNVWREVIVADFKVL
jgi:hypothetical protein